MDTAAILIGFAFCGLVVLFIMVAASQPKRHEPARFERDDFGKVRVFTCHVCGGYCVRHLRGEVAPCERCDTELGLVPAVIEDHRLFVGRVLAERGLSHDE